MPFTKYLSTQILNHVFSKTELTQFTFEAALFGREIGPVAFTELRVEGYTRVMVPSDVWFRIGTGKVVNNKPIIFRQVNRPVIVNAIGLYKYPQGDSILVWKILDEPFVHNKGNIYINPWCLEITLGRKAD